MQRERSSIGVLTQMAKLRKALLSFVLSNRKFLAHITILIGMFFTGFAQAQNVVQSLNVKKSSIKFVLSSDWFQLPGTVNKSSGTITLHRSDLSLSEVEFSVDLSGVMFDLAQGVALQFAVLLKQITNPVGRFTSKKIVRKKKDEYLVTGTLVRGGMRRSLVIPIKVNSATLEQTTVQVLYSGAIEQWDTDLRLPIIPPNTQGKVWGTLVFSTEHLPSRLK
jgi:polyisoprenoid-binding protein YceI